MTFSSQDVYEGTTLRDHPAPRRSPGSEPLLSIQCSQPRPSASPITHALKTTSPRVHLTDVSLRSAKSGSRHQSACSNHISSTSTNPVLPVSNLVLAFQRYAERHPHRYSLLCHSVRWGGHLNGIVQTCHPLWWFKYVPQIAVVHTLDTQRFAPWVCSSDPPWSHD